MALVMIPSLRYLTAAWAMSTATLSCASTVDAPRWGVVTRLSSSRSFFSDSSRGSLHQTSKAAPAMVCSFRAL